MAWAKEWHDTEEQPGCKVGMNEGLLVQISKDFRNIHVSLTRGNVFLANLHFIKLPFSFFFASIFELQLHFCGKMLFIVDSLD